MTAGFASPPQPCRNMAAVAPIYSSSRSAATPGYSAEMSQPWIVEGWQETLNSRQTGLPPESLSRQMGRRSHVGASSLGAHVTPPLPSGARRLRGSDDVADPAHTVTSRADRRASTAALTVAAASSPK